MIPVYIDTREAIEIYEGLQRLAALGIIVAAIETIVFINFLIIWRKTTGETGEKKTRMPMRQRRRPQTAPKDTKTENV